MLFVDDVRSSRSSRTDHRQLTISTTYSRNHSRAIHSTDTIL